MGCSATSVRDFQDKYAFKIFNTPENSLIAVYNSMLLVYLELCNHHHHLIIEHFYHPQRNLKPINN